MKEGDQTVGGDISKVEREYTDVTDIKIYHRFYEVKKLERKGANGLRWRWLSRKRRGYVLRVETILPLASIRSRNGQKGSGKVTEVVESHRDVCRGG